MMEDMAKVQMMEQCALVRAKVRHGLMTFNLRGARFDGATVIRFGRLPPKDCKELSVEIQNEAPQLSAEKN